MAKKDEVKLNYKSELLKLRQEGPKRLYFMWGPEEYLRESFLKELKKTCLPDGEDSFSYKRIDGPELDKDELRLALDALPFMTDRTFVELRAVDVNRLKNTEAITELLSDIPDYCTVAFVEEAEYEPDNRLKLIKTLKTAGYEMKFTNQNSSSLVEWIVRRFSALGKRIEFEAAQRLIFVSGDLMHRLIPEIEKIAAYAKTDIVTVYDVEAVAHHIPEAVIFEMTDCIAEKQYDRAIGILTELLADKDNEPIAMLAMVGAQMRKLYAAKLLAGEPNAVKALMELYGIRFDGMARKLIVSARSFRVTQLENAVALCAEADYRMKNGDDAVSVLQETVVRIAAEDMYAQGQ